MSFQYWIMLFDQNNLDLHPKHLRSIQNRFGAIEGQCIRKFWPLSLPKCQRFLWTTHNFSRLSKKTPNRFMTSITEHNHPFYFAPDFHTKFLTRKVINQNSIDENSIDLWRWSIFKETCSWHVFTNSESTNT